MLLAKLCTPYKVYVQHVFDVCRRPDSMRTRNSMETERLLSISRCMRSIDLCHCHKLFITLTVNIGCDFVCSVGLAIWTALMCSWGRTLNLTSFILSYLRWYSRISWKNNYCAYKLSSGEWREQTVKTCYLPIDVPICIDIVLGWRGYIGLL